MVWAAVGPLLQLPGHGPSNLEDVGMDGVHLTAGQLVVGLFMERLLKDQLGEKKRDQDKTLSDIMSGMASEVFLLS